MRKQKGLTQEFCRSRKLRRPRTASSLRVVLRTEALEDRLLPSLTPTLFKDINPGVASSTPESFTQVNNLLFFQADDGTHGAELWASNGSAAGTFLVKDINPGASSSTPYNFTNVNGTLFFSANDGTHGLELWASNGSAAGTFLVKDINPGAGSSLNYNSYPTNVNGTVFFSVNDGTHGAELWASNGSAAGTFLVRDINPGMAGSFPPVASHMKVLTNVNGSLFFQADDGTHGTELWASNGTAAGTSLVKDTNPGSSSGYAYYLTNVNGTVFFGATDGTHGAELWASNGSAAGTFLVKDINPGANNSGPSFLTNVNGSLFFSANDGTHGVELWASNGSAAGTALVKDINPGSGFSSPYYLTNVNGTLFFRANDGSDGDELWASNGSAAGTFLVKDIAGTLGDSFPSQLTNVNGALFFQANDGIHGRELWESNGTAAGTSLVTDINPGTGSYPYYLTNFGSSLLFSANDGVDGAEPWILQFNTSTTTAVSSSPNPSALSQAVTFTATVSGVAPGVPLPTATVDFKEGSTDLTPGGVTLVGNQATFSTAALAVGNHTITAVYGGGNLLASQGDDSASPQVVNKDSSTTSLVLVSGASVFGQPMAFIAFVAAMGPAAGAPGGNVTFKDGSTTLAANVNLSDGHAGFITASLSVGVHTITAFYSGDSNFQASSASRKVIVNKAATSTALTSSPHPSVFGQAVFFTATVLALAPGGGTPTGTVDFKEGATDLTPGGIALSGGRATFLTAALAVGQHTITATYGGSTNYMGSQATDSAAPQVVNQALSRTVLTSFPDPSVFGQVVSFTVLVSALPLGRGTPTGAVIFTDGTTSIGSISLTGGRATFTTASLSRGNHAINASYGGDSDFAASAYTNFGQTVLKDLTTTTVAPSANPMVVGQTLTLTATVQASSPGTGTPTGTVTFMDFSTPLGTGTLNGTGKATFTTSGLAVGAHAITVSYAGDNNFTSSASALLTETVKTSASAALLGPPATRSTESMPAPTAVGSVSARGLSAKQVDAFFNSSAHRVRIPSAPAAPPRAAVARDDPFDICASHTLHMS
jgi:ELWxxDGT repeat protein